MENKKRSQICFDIDQEQKRTIKANAALRGISVNQWIKRALQKEIERQFLNK